MSLFDQKPRISASAFVAPSASVIGNVELWDKVSIWYGAVIRGKSERIHFLYDCLICGIIPALMCDAPPLPVAIGDRNSVKIGGLTNVQDHTVISTVASLESGFPSKVTIGNYVTIGA